MHIISLPQIATYISYILIILLYTIKVVKIARMPVHLRWELYPVPHEKGYQYGGSYLEESEWWTKPRQNNRMRGILLKLRDYFTFPGYFQRQKGYWLGLYPWHIGFYLIVTFHIISFFAALLILTTHINIAANSASNLGIFIYYLTLIVAITSFILGSVGSIVLLVKRLTDRGLRNYAVASNYFNYSFFLVVFLSGLAAWYFTDRTFASYREFWQGLITFQYQTIPPLVYTHIMLFSLFLIYLPFTRSTHYITKIFAFFGVLWDDTPVIDDQKMQTALKQELAQTVRWSAAHIQRGKNWLENAQEMPDNKK